MLGDWRSLVILQRYIGTASVTGRMRRDLMRALNYEGSTSPSELVRTAKRELVRGGRGRLEPTFWKVSLFRDFWKVRLFRDFWKVRFFRDFWKVSVFRDFKKLPTPKPILVNFIRKHYFHI